MKLSNTPESFDEMSVEEIQEFVGLEADRLKKLGNWPGYIDAEGSLVTRIPVGESKASGFDAGIACALQMIPEDKQRLSAILHAAYTKEAVKQIRDETIRTEFDQEEDFEADSETTWWLAACSLCKEGNTSEKDFREQLNQFAELAANPKARIEAAKKAYLEMKNSFQMGNPHTNGLPYGEVDGCMQAAYLDGYLAAVGYNPHNGLYFIGTYEESLGLEDFPWEKDVDADGRPTSGPVHHSRQFVKCANLDELERATAIVAKKFGLK